MPDPRRRSEGVFADALEPLGDGQAPWSCWERRGARMPEMTYLEAISDGLREEMRRDESVFCLGEDIGAFGGAFKVTDGFIEEFGAERVLDTPLAENAIIGAAVGAAVEGLRPVCEMQFADFISCGFDQLVNVAAKLHYRQGVAAPMVVRLPSGGGFSGGPFHSQNPEAWFLQSPGLKVVAPATADDAKGLLDGRDPRPEPGLLPRAQGPLPPRQGRGPRGRATRSPLGKARVAREGEEMTVIAYGSAVAPRARGRRGARRVDRGDRPALALPAGHRGDPGQRAQDRQGAGRPRGDADRAASAPRSPRWSPTRRSRTSTRRCARLTAPDVPIPFSPPLEQAVLPQLDDMKEACRELLAY